MKLLSLFRPLIDLFYPRLCIICKDALVEGEESLCLHCLDDMPRTRYHLERDNPLARLFWGKVEVEQVSALFYFAHHLGYREVIHHIKYRDGFRCARHLGALAARELSATGFYDDIDLLIPVPLHPKRKRTRGYNQSEHIARGIASVTGIPIQTTALVRKIHNPTQTRLQREERWENVRDIFALADSEILRDKHILLVDDVLTSGSTLEACAIRLLEAEGTKVSIFTLASVL